MKNLAVIAGNKKTFTVMLEITPLDVEDLEILLHSVDGYYTPYGGSTARLHGELHDLVEHLSGLVAEHGPSVTPTRERSTAIAENFLKLYGGKVKK